MEAVRYSETSEYLHQIICCQIAEKQQIVRINKWFKFVRLSYWINSLFDAEDGRSTLLRNVWILIQNYMSPDCRKNKKIKV
jgi:hypothetical protein